jgi:hypothetical protein
MLLETPDLLLDLDEEAVPYEGTPIGAHAPQVGHARTYRVLGLNPQEVELVVYDVSWVDGSREVFAPEREEGNHPRFDGIVGRLRLGVHTLGPISYIMLGVVALPEGGRRASMRWPALPEISESAGAPLDETLVGAGALRVGTREEVLGDDGTQRQRIAATFDPMGAPHVPAMAFVLTRVAPIARASS